ncbi:MAG: hypothetical protein ACKVOU_09965 [Cytophagales bacterium]
MPNQQSILIVIILVAILGLLTFNTFQNSKNQNLNVKFDSLRTSLKIATDNINETQLLLTKVTDSLQGFNKQIDFIRNQVQQVNIARQIENLNSGKERADLSKELKVLNNEEDRLKRQLDSLKTL